MNPPAQMRRGEEEGCQNAQTFDLGVDADKLQPHSLGRARGMETLWIHAVRGEDTC